MGKPSGRQQVAAVLGGVAVLLGGGGGAGYYLHSSTAKAAEAPPPLERLAALEQWRAAETVLRERDREERIDLTRAIREANVTNAAVRDVVIALTERVGAMDARLKTVEYGGVRPASGKR